ncbi:phytoene desaturase family protein [Candidatus Lokiarchaeum ossiferum]|uniref:phytoene desaturase family protein n=1 Tax=Candidatus Lokiarchaeum ossiferum TaxID=2951803 RepID=UPI00352CB82E
MSKKIIIIGGGIAGLAAGSYAAMNGFSPKIYEMHSLPGGVCTGWQRDGFWFDGCIHWLIGTGHDAGTFKQIWDELGALKNKKITNHDIFKTIINSKGQEFVVYTNADRFRDYMLTLAPEDHEAIDSFYYDTLEIADMELPIKPQKLWNVRDYLQFISQNKSIFKSMGRLSKISIEEYAKSFTNPLLQEMIPKIFPLPDFPAVAAFMTLGHLHYKNAGWPEGGAYNFSKSIVTHYLEMGGKIQYNSKVVKILVKKKKAIGILLDNGEKVYADYIISAADGYSTIFQMLEGKYLDEKIKKHYDETPLFTPLIMASFGVNQGLSFFDHSTDFEFSKPKKVGSNYINSINIKHYNFDPTMAPDGKAVVIVGFETSYKFWEEMYEKKEEYEYEKEKIHNDLLKILDEIIPNFSQNVNVSDIATPMTWVRYTGNWKGSFEGWLINTKTLRKKIPKKLPKLKNFYMIGQWTTIGGGLPPAAKDGRDIVQYICKKEKLRFHTNF